MFWLSMLLILLVFGLPLMLVFAAFSVGIWIVGAVLGLVWAVLSFLFHDAGMALLVVGALWLGFRWGQKRQGEQRRA